MILRRNKVKTQKGRINAFGEETCLYISFPFFFGSPSDIFSVCIFLSTSLSRRRLSSRSFWLAVPFRLTTGLFESFFLLSDRPLWIFSSAPVSHASGGTFPPFFSVVWLTYRVLSYLVLTISWLTFWIYGKANISRTIHNRPHTRTHAHLWRAKFGYDHQ